MELTDRVIVITGGASGIGEALARRFANDSPAAIVVADIDLAGAEAVAASIGPIATARRCDVSDGAAIAALIAEVVAQHGRIDLYCSNAGIATGKGVEADDATWQSIWDINLMANVHAARALMPLAEPDAPVHLMITASAAGLLINLGDAAYTATKHAAVGLAEWLAVTHGDAGLKVSCLCPQGVRTPMVMAGLGDNQLAANVVEAMGLIEPEQCAETVVEALADERFLILPHPEVAKYQRAKVEGPDRWIATMRGLQARLLGTDR